MTTQYVRHTVNLTRKPTSTNHTTIPFKHVLVCDIETTTDFAQTLRIAGYVVYDMELQQIKERGLTTGLLTATELETLHAYAAARNLVVMSQADFIIKRLYPLLSIGTALVNHNIAFDLGGMATDWIADMKTGGFYLKLCSCKPSNEQGFNCNIHPSITVKSLNFPKAIMYVASPDTAYGPILDTMTIGRALLGPGDMSLLGMGKRFKCETVKHIAESHGDTLDNDYLDYTCNDVQATLELFLAELREYNRHGLVAPISAIMSEASIGKAYLKQLDIPPFYEKHKELPDWINPISISGYYGARSEVKIRLSPTEIAYCDFKSEYPTVNALLDLQELLLADYITVKHNTAAVQQFLDQIELQHLQRPAIWKKLRVLVKFAPDNDIVPNKFKTHDQGETVSGYAVAYTNGPASWYALSDAIASKLLTGKSPTLIDAICMYPTGRVATNKLTLFGDERYSIDLAHQDFFTEVINLRTSVKADMATAKATGDTDEYTYLDSLQLALKLLANSTSYGVLVETRNEQGIETAGKFYASPVAVHITAAARLLLAIAERLGRDRALDYAMCDTDSMAYARPDSMARDTFYQLVDECAAWFTPLSPYANNPDGSIPALFELEDVNYVNNTRIPLYFLGVSCKRYALYNHNGDGSYSIRKVSAHATGRYTFDRQLPIPEDIPNPPTKMKQWHYLLWYRAIQAAEAGQEITIPAEDWSHNIARYQESISTPGKAKMYRYIPGIRPYSFFTAFPVRLGSKQRYLMPFTATHDAIQASPVYCTGSMEIVQSPLFDTLADRFDNFFTHSEVKAANGHATGLLQRRSLNVSDIQERTRSNKTVQIQPSLWDIA